MNWKALVLVVVSLVAVVLVVVERNPTPEAPRPAPRPQDTAVAEMPADVLEYPVGQSDRVRGAPALQRIACEDGGIVRAETSEGSWSAGVRETAAWGCAQLLGQLRVAAPDGSRVGVEVREGSQPQITFLSDRGSSMSMPVTSVTRESQPPQGSG